MSGGVVGSILGRVMGIPRYRVFTIVAASSAAGAFPIAAATFLLGPRVLDWASGWAASGLPLVLGVVVLVSFIAAIAYMVRRSRRNHDEAA
jgi:membrane protein DedA with SNARE-associated domain